MIDMDVGKRVTRLLVHLYLERMQSFDEKGGKVLAAMRGPLWPRKSSELLLELRCKPLEGRFVHVA